MLGKIQSAALCGLDGKIVEVEVDLLGGLPAFIIVGLPDPAIQESKERIRSAIQNSGFFFSMRRIVVNLAPADLRKVGPHYDLPIAIGLLTVEGVVPKELIKDTVIVGELALDGSVRPIHGILSITECARQNGFKKIVVPTGNAAEAHLITGIEVIPIDDLKNVKAILRQEKKLSIKKGKRAPAPRRDIDMADVKGQQQAKRALLIAAAGSHNLLLGGAPGAGKTMMAKAMRGILPQMTLQEALNVTKVYSIAGRLGANEALIAERPFRSVHHTASAVSIVGGGNPPRPGEISLAHHGILFMDELAEFPTHVLEVLRQPMEDHHITISRATGSYRYPSQFTLIAAMNPCPCGYFGIKNPARKCDCAANRIHLYQKKISGPLLDRIDMQLFIEPVDPKQLENETPSESSAAIQKRVEQARRVQARRFKNDPIHTNGEMGNREIKKYCRLDKKVALHLHRAMERFGHSARAYFRIIKLARTIADLEAREAISRSDISEAIQYRRRLFE